MGTGTKPLEGLLGLNQIWRQQHFLVGFCVLLLLLLLPRLLAFLIWFLSNLSGVQSPSLGFVKTLEIACQLFLAASPIRDTTAS